MKTKPLFISLTVGLALVLALWPPMARPVEAEIYTVSTVVDENDGSCSDGDCSLRDAIILANNNPGPDTITFNISGCGGVCTIQLHSELPFLLGGGTTIDGYTQPGAAEATDGTPATLLIEINGASAGDSNGFYITSAGNVIKGLVINRFFRRGVYIYGSGATGNTVSGNYIGTNISGTAAMDNGGSGVSIHEDAQYNTIGGNAPNERNVISGNDGDGVDINGSGHNTVSGNYIGTDVSGTAAIPNGEFGVGVCCGASNNTIGGDTPGERNVIVGSSGSGVAIFRDGTSNNVVIGNYIGTDSSGMAALPNSTGVEIMLGAQYNTVGGTTPGRCNVISGNEGSGISIEGSGTMSNTVSGNYIGTDASGTAALPNADDGIDITDGASYNIIGGDTAGERNLISGHKLHSAQVSVHGTGTDHNILSGNYIGTDMSGFQALGGGYGVRIESGAQYNVIGGTTSSERNLISGNGQDGVVINDSGTMSNTVSGNYIGTDASGTAALGNASGVTFNLGSQHNGVEGNVIGGNHGGGVLIQASGTMYNVVSGNYIGVDVNGTTAIPNGSDGVCITPGASYNVIGQGNVIAYNTDRGVSIGGSTALYNTITRNSIHSNTYQGIDNWDGGNAELSPPALTDVTATLVSGIAPVAYATVEIFSDAADEGRVYEGTTTAGAGGFFSFSKADGFTGPYLTATSTDADGNTSEFSAPVAGPVAPIYLPVVMRGYCSCGPDNYEPNDSFAQAYGPLTSGQTYQSWISCCDVASRRDYFYIDISTTNPIEVDLTDIPAGIDYDLYLYNSAQVEVGRSQNDDNAPEHISHTPAGTGRYYILVFSPFSHYSASPYSLRVTYDSQSDG